MIQTAAFAPWIKMSSVISWGSIFIGVLLLVLRAALRLITNDYFFSAAVEETQNGD